MPKPSLPAQDPSVNHFENGTVEQQILRACQTVADCASRNALHNIETMKQCSDDVQSPLEAVFLVWWAALTSQNLDTFNRVLLLSQCEVEANGRTYRLDFAMRPKGGRGASVAVELDGHEWHERTKKQVAARDSRDRDLQRAGWTVFHFSGHEFLKNPAACIIQAATAAEPTPDEA